MNRREYYLTHSGKSEFIESETGLRQILNRQILTKEEGVLSLELRKGPPAKKWEKVIYPLFGLKVPINVTGLTVYWSGEHAFVTFEDDDSEWVAVRADVSVASVVIPFKTEAGEPFPIPSRNCILKQEGIRLAELFFQSAKRPAGTKWLKSDQLSS